MVEPVVKELAAELQGKVAVYKVNVDQNPRIAQKFNIYGVPAFLLFREGKVVNQAIGARSKAQLLHMAKETFGIDMA